MLDYLAKGTYFAHSTTTLLDLDLAEVVRCSERHTVKHPSNHDGFYNFSLRTDLDPSLDDIQSLLVHCHERHHYTQLMSTPTGALIWRLMNCRLSTVNFLGRHIRRSPAASTARLPIQQWLRGGGLEALRSEPPTIPDSLKNKDQLKPRLLDAIEHSMHEIEVLGFFLQCIMGREPISMRQFVTVANLAFQSLRERSDLDVNFTWTARNLEAESYLPSELFTTTEVIEGGARLVERGLLDGLQASKSLREEWHSRSIFGIYKPCYDWLSAELVESWAGCLAVDIALMAPMDLICADAVDGKFIVEDVLPGWRLPRIVTSMKDCFWSLEAQGQHKYALEVVASAAGLPTPRAVLESALGHSFTGAESWESAARAHGVPIEATHLECFSYTESEIHRAFRDRLANALSFVPVPGRHVSPGTLQPTLEIFRDTAFCHLSPTTEASDGIHYKFYLNMLICLAESALTTDGNVSVLPHIQKSFLARYPSLQDSLGPGMWDARHIVRNAIGDELFSLLSWE